MRIQAVHLADAGLHTGAVELLDRILNEFPEGIQLAQTYLQKAESLASLGDLESATNEFRAALQAERDFPNVRTQAWLEFGWFAVRHQMTNLYGEVLNVLKEFREESGMTFR